MPRVGNRQANKVVPHDFQLSGGVADCDAQEEEQPVEIGELVGESYAAGVQGAWGRNLWDLVDDKRVQVYEWERPAGDSAVVSGGLERRVGAYKVIGSIMVKRM